MSIKTHPGTQTHVKVAPNEQHCWKHVGLFGLARSHEGQGWRLIKTFQMAQ